ncbi:MAG: ROK family glucokinase [Actinomycetales bacterium]|nr:ROK family glucokinase [Actinomycetales bacterium]
MYAIGVDIGGTKIAAGVVDEDGTILAKSRRATATADSSSVDRGVIEAVRELAEQFEIGAVGLVAPGFVSSDQRTVMFTPNLPWRNHPLRDNVASALELDVPIVVENDANAAAWAEFRFGAGRGVDDMVLLTIGTGLGCGAVVDGVLLRGAWGIATEAGHLRVVPNGHQCGCGLRGCWEQYASGNALVRNARAAIETRPDEATAILDRCDGDAASLKGPAVTKAAQAGDPLAIELLAELGTWIGEGSAAVGTIIDPALIVIGGGVAAAGDLLLEPARAGFLSQLSGRGHRPVASIELASMGNDAGLVGAADLARTAV